MIDRATTRKKLPALVMIILVGLISGAAGGGLSNGLAKTLFCGVTGSSTGTNCLDQYCDTNLVDPSHLSSCSSQSCYFLGQRTTTQTTTSTTFVNVVTATDSGFPICQGAIAIFTCIVTFNFKTNLLTGNAQFRIIDDSNGFTSSVYQYDDASQAAISSDVMGSIMWSDTFQSAPLTWSFQAKVSSNLITLSIVKADISCMNSWGIVG